MPTLLVFCVVVHLFAPPRRGGMEQTSTKKEEKAVAARSVRRNAKKDRRALHNGPFLFRSSLVNRNLFPILAQTLKTDHAVRLGEQGAVAAAADIHTGVNVGPPLADENVAGQYVLAVGPLGTQALALGITAVLGGTNALFVGEKL